MKDSNNPSFPIFLRASTTLNHRQLLDAFGLHQILGNCQISVRITCQKSTNLTSVPYLPGANSRNKTGIYLYQIKNKNFKYHTGKHTQAERKLSSSFYTSMIVESPVEASLDVLDSRLMSPYVSIPSSKSSSSTTSKQFCLQSCIYFIASFNVKLNETFA